MKQAKMGGKLRLVGMHYFNVGQMLICQFYSGWVWSVTRVGMGPTLMSRTDEKKRLYRRLSRQTTVGDPAATPPRHRREPATDRLYRRQTGCTGESQDTDTGDRPATGRR